MASPKKPKIINLKTKKEEKPIRLPPLSSEGFNPEDWEEVVVTVSYKGTVGKSSRHMSKSVFGKKDLSVQKKLLVDEAKIAAAFVMSELFDLVRKKD